ncbi:MAG: hypothetical protein H8M99_02255 [Gloeobacteraceae cyanobacterium ES-bin-144]|nr:hypothetical protein [Verrucomicrobiales bacterium]
MKTTENLPVNEWNHQLSTLVIASAGNWQQLAPAHGTQEIPTEAASNDGINQENDAPNFMVQPDV